MHSANEFLTNLALVLCVAAITTVVFQRFRQPVVLGYLLAGALVSPHTAFPLFADAKTIETISELGVILLMFSLGLEFSFSKLLRVGVAAGFVAVLQCSLMTWLGYVTARFLGWNDLESLYAGGLIAISSTTIIVKAFAEQGIRGRLAEIVFGILIFEDLIAIVLLTVLSTVSLGISPSAEGIFVMLGKLGAFLAVVVGGGLLLIPALTRSILRLKRPETTLVAHVGLCFGFALLAQTAGYSVALGAFLGGALVGESGESESIEHLIQPVRDMFGAIFFVAVGMLIDPELILEHWVAVAVFAAVVVLGKVVSVAIGVFLTGQAVRTALQAGMSLAQIGEFSFIIAAAGVATGAVRDFLYPVAVAVSAVTTLVTPWLIRASDPVAAFVDRHLPHRLQTLTALYGSWLEQLRHSPPEPTLGTKSRRLLRLLVVDSAFLAAIVTGAAIGNADAVELLRAWVGLPGDVLWLLVVAVAVVAAVPFCVGIARCSSTLAITLATAAFPVRTDAPDTAAAPRRALIVLLQIAILLLVGTPLVAVTQPFLPTLPAATALVLGLAIVSVGLWRSATNLQEHAQAGAMVIVEALARHLQNRSPDPPDTALRSLESVLPGLGAPVPIQLDQTSPAIGKTLAQLNLRGLTGATVLAIVRHDGNVATPTGKEVLRARDTLAIAGTHEAVEAARRLLVGPVSNFDHSLREP